MGEPFGPTGPILGLSCVQVLEAGQRDTGSQDDVMVKVCAEGEERRKTKESLVPLQTTSSQHIHDLSDGTSTHTNLDTEEGGQQREQMETSQKTQGGSLKIARVFVRWPWQIFATIMLLTIILLVVVAVAYPLQIDYYRSPKAFTFEDGVISESKNRLIAAHNVFGEGFSKAAMLYFSEHDYRRRAVTFTGPRVTYLVLSYWVEPSVITQSYLQQIARLENAITNHPNYLSVCLRSDSGNCKPPRSVVNLFMDGSNPSIRLSQILNSQSKDRSWYFESGANSRQPTSRLLRSAFPLVYTEGGKNGGYASLDMVVDFMKDVRPIITAHTPPGLQVVWANTHLLDSELEDSLQHDELLIVATVAVLFVCLWLLLGSAFLSLMGIVFMGLSFPVSYFIYRVMLGQTYFGSMNLLVVFVALGISADNVFIFTNNFLKYTTAPSKPAIVGDEESVCAVPLDVRLAAAYRRSFKALSLTTFAAVATISTNLISPLLAISTFALFMGIVISINYLLIFSVFPCVLVIWARYLEGKPFLMIKRLEGISYEPLKFSRTFFGRTYPTFLFSTPLRRGLVFVTSALLLGLAVWAMTGLQAADGNVPLLAAHLNYQRYLDVQSTFGDPLAGMADTDIASANRVQPVTLDPSKTTLVTATFVADFPADGGEPTIVAVNPTNTVKETKAIFGVSPPTRRPPPNYASDVPVVTYPGGVFTVYTQFLTQTPTPTFKTVSTSTPTPTMSINPTPTRTPAPAQVQWPELQVLPRGACDNATAQAVVEAHRQMQSLCFRFGNSLECTDECRAHLSSLQSNWTTCRQGATPVRQSELIDISINNCIVARARCLDQVDQALGLVAKVCMEFENRPQECSQACGVTIDNMQTVWLQCSEYQRDVNSTATRYINKMMDGCTNRELGTTLAGNLVEISLLWGVVGSRQASGDEESPGNPHLLPIYDAVFDFYDPDVQRGLVDACLALATDRTLSHVAAKPLCAAAALQEYAKVSSRPWPLAGSQETQNMFVFEFISNNPSYSQLVYWRCLEDTFAACEISALGGLFYSPVRKDDSVLSINRAYGRWQEGIQRVNMATGLRASQYSPQWTFAFSQVHTVNGVTWAIGLSLAVALLALLLFSTSIRLTLLGGFCLLVIMSFALAAVRVLGWRIGMTEALSISILLGITVNYILLSSEEYVVISAKANGVARYDIVCAVLERLAMPILYSSTTAILATIVLLAAHLVALKDVGILLCVAVFFSVVVALTLYPALLTAFAPEKVTRTVWRLARTVAVAAGLVGVVVLVLFIVSVCGVEITGPTGKIMFS